LGALLLEEVVFILASFMEEYSFFLEGRRMKRGMHAAEAFEYWFVV
jgi:hypothetical protein